MIVLLGGLLGVEMAPNPALATLPISLMVIGMALATVPAALLMRRIGRRHGFILAALVASLGALLAAVSITRDSFSGFSAAITLIGTTLGFVQQYRFAAVESAPPDQAGQAVSYIMIGGILAGILGPQIALWTQDWLPTPRYSGSFAALAGIYLLVAGLLAAGYRDLAAPAGTAGGLARPLLEVVRQPLFLTAMLSAAVSYAVMSFIMTATPLHLVNDSGYSIPEATFIIQSHILAMFLPSLFTGLLIARLGLFRVMLTGLASLVACTLLAVFSRTLPVYWLALVLLGVGWNFLFVGGTVLLTRTYRPPERFRAQAFNDLVVFGSQAIASFSAGGVLYLFNWEILNWIGLGFSGFLVIVLLAYRAQISTTWRPEPAPAD